MATKRKKSKGRKRSMTRKPFSPLADQLRAGGMAVIFVKPIPYDASPAEKAAYSKRVARATVNALKD